MATIWASQALTAEGWASDVRLTIGGNGHIASVETGAPKRADWMVDSLLPAPANAHSHAFQRAMAGLTERRGPDPHDTFWTWRKLMFGFLSQLGPDHVEAIAALVQMEMLEAGYASCAEFHYLHHQPNGQLYGNIAEMAERVVAAAAQTGIGLTLLPVFYLYGGCDRRPLGEGQIRFGNDEDRFATLFGHSKSALAHLPPDSCMGVAPHSLRAVPPEALAGLIGLAPEGPIHMHLAEQTSEVDEVRAALGKRPVEWMLEAHDLDQRFTFIHCTQMQPHETEALARTGAVAGLCPITESNLGDGIFDAVRWMNEQGSIAIGSDSNVRIAMSEELRTLEYSQRLRDRSRVALGSADKSTGRRLFEAAVRGGAKATGRKTGSIAPGFLADLVALDGQCVDLQGREGDLLLDTFIFAGDDTMVCDVWSAGRHLVHNGRHVEREAILGAYGAAMGSLRVSM